MNSSGSQIHQSIYQSTSHQQKNKRNDAPFILQSQVQIMKDRNLTKKDSAKFILQNKNSLQSQNTHLSKIQQTPFILQSKVTRVNINATNYNRQSKAGSQQDSKLQNKASIQSRVSNYKANNQQTANNIQNKTSLQSKNTLIDKLDMSRSRNDILQLSKTTSKPIDHKFSLPQRYQKKQQRPATANMVNQQARPQQLPSPQLDQPFIKYYEQNIQLKSKQRQMQRQINQLKNQLYEQSIVRKAMDEKQLQSLAAGKRNVWSAKQPQKFKNMQQKDKDGNKITNLLQIIEHYKQKLLTSQQQIQNLKRQKHLLEQDGALKQRKAEQAIKTFKDSQSKVHTTAALEEQLKNTTRLLEIQKQRNKYNQVDIRRLEAKIRALEMRQDQTDQLKIQNRNLQEQIVRMTQLPSFSHANDRAQSQRKAKQYQQKYRAATQKYNKLNQKTLKTEADVKLLRNQLIKANIQCDNLQKQNYKLKQYSLQNPILSQLALDQDLLAEVVLEIRHKKENKVKSNMSKNKIDREDYEGLILEKEELVKEMDALRSRMTAMQENWKEKERLSKIQKQELISTFKEQVGSAAKNQIKVMSKNGVPYTDDVSMFTQDSVSVPNGSNYFDLFLGDLHLLQTMLITQFNIRSTENALILATVDFYNHNTQTTRPIHGVHSNLQSQFSFKVTQDQFFFKYLNKGNFTIEIWASQGNKRINLGKATVDLKPLITRSRKNLAPVANSSAPIYVNQKVMGSINFVMRIRLPIFQQLQRISQIQQIVSSEQAPIRKLIIQIQQGRGFSPSSNTFVYYPFRLQDHYTKTFKGSNPVWNHTKSLQVKYNTDLKNYLRKNELQLIVLDDNAIITSQGDSDVIGSAHISLVPLLENKVIRDRLTVMKGAQKVGQIDVKVFWHEVQTFEGKEIKLMEGRTLGEDIVDFLAVNRMQPEQVFYKIDSNRTGMISFQQFHAWILKINAKAHYDMVSLFYKQFKQPVNMINFTTRLHQLKNDKKQQTNEMAKQLSEINRLVSQNTEMIKKKQSFEDYLKGKDIETVILDIDKSRNGMISREEIQEYFEAHNIEPLTSQIDKGEIKITKFLRKYM